MLTDTAVNTSDTDFSDPSPGRRGSKKALNKFEARRIRHGKTQRDHATGAWRARQDNLEARGAWSNEVRAKNGICPSPPKCHGLGNGAKRFKIKAAKRAKQVA